MHHILLLNTIFILLFTFLNIYYSNRILGIAAVFKFTRPEFDIKKSSSLKWYWNILEWIWILVISMCIWQKSIFGDFFVVLEATLATFCIHLFSEKHCIKRCTPYRLRRFLKIIFRYIHIYPLPPITPERIFSKTLYLIQRIKLHVLISIG